MKYAKSIVAALEAREQLTASVEEARDMLKQAVDIDPRSMSELSTELETISVQLEAICMHADEMLVSGVSRGLVESLERVCPGVITKTISLESFTRNESSVNLSVSQESMSKSVWTLIGLALVALGAIIIKFIKYLFEKSRTVERERREYEENAERLTTGYLRIQRVKQRLSSTARYDFNAKRYSDGVHGAKYQYSTREHRVSQYGYSMFSREKLYVDWVNNVNKIPKLLERAEYHYTKLYQVTDIIKMKWPEIRKEIEPQGREAVAENANALLEALKPVRAEMDLIIAEYQNWAKHLVLDIRMGPGEHLDLWPHNCARFALQFQKINIETPASPTTADFMEHEVLEGKRSLLFPDNIKDETIKKTVNDLDRARRARFDANVPWVDAEFARASRAATLDVHRRWIVSTLQACLTMYTMYNYAVDEGNKTHAYFIRLLKSDVELLKEVINKHNEPKAAELIKELDLGLMEFEKMRGDLARILATLNLDVGPDKPKGKVYAPADLRSKEEQAALDNVDAFTKAERAEWEAYVRQQRGLGPNDPVDI